LHDASFLTLTSIPAIASPSPVYQHLDNVNLPARSGGYLPPDLQQFTDLTMGFKVGDLPNAEAYYSRAINLHLYVGHTEADQDFVIATLKEVLQCGWL
jgi:dTDP-4-amino-4,6-dideoxygalactose transaminase